MTGAGACSTSTAWRALRPRSTSEIGHRDAGIARHLGQRALLLRTMAAQHVADQRAQQ
jgi:hypothetical protein